MALVPVERVLALCNPLVSWPWASPAPTPAQLEVFLAGAPLEAEPVDTTQPPERHVGRIRYLMQNGWAEAIELDVGIPVLGYWGPAWAVIDGNHRLAAASLRGDALIDADIAGQLDHAAHLLGVPESDLMGAPAEKELLHA